MSMISHLHLPRSRGNLLSAEAQALEASMDAIRKARGKPTRAEIHAMGIGTPEHKEAVGDFLQDMFLLFAGDPDASFRW